MTVKELVMFLSQYPGSLKIYVADGEQGFIHDLDINDIIEAQKTTDYYKNKENWNLNSFDCLVIES